MGLILTIAQIAIHQIQIEYKILQIIIVLANLELLIQEK